MEEKLALPKSTNALHGVLRKGTSEVSGLFKRVERTLVEDATRLRIVEKQNNRLKEEFDKLARTSAEHDQKAQLLKLAQKQSTASFAILVGSATAFVGGYFAIASPLATLPVSNEVVTLVVLGLMTGIAAAGWVVREAGHWWLNKLNKLVQDSQGNYIWKQ